VVAKVVTEDLDMLEGFVSEKIRTVPNVLVTSTMIISREYKGRNHSRRPINNAIAKLLFHRSQDLIHSPNF